MLFPTLQAFLRPVVSGQPRPGLSLLWLVLLLPLPLMAGPKIAVFGLHTTGIPPEQANKVLEALENGLRQSQVFTLLSDDAIVQNFTPRAQEIQEALFLLPGRALLQEARVYAEQVQFDKAIERLEQAESFFIFYSEHLTANQELIEIQLSLAQLYAGRGDQEAMEDRLRRLTLLAPEKELDSARASPQMLEAHRRIKSEMQLNTANLELVSQPAGARVYVNGAFRGVTPTQLTGLPQGRYFISLRHDDGRRFFQEAMLSRPGVTQVGGTLVTPNLYSASRPLPPAVGEARLFEAYRTLGAKAGANFVLLGHLKPDGLEVQLLDVTDGQKGPLYQAPVAANLSNLSSSLRNLILQLETLVNPAGRLLRTTTYPLTTDPSNNLMLSRFIFVQAAGALGEGEKNARKANVSATPFYQQRWFLAVAGGVVLAAAGGTTAAVVATQQDSASVGQVRFEFK